MTSLATEAFKVDQPKAVSSSPGPISGVGLGLRAPHYQTILNDLPTVPWFEALTDNYLNEGGYPLHFLERVASHYPLTFHGVGMSLGGTDPLDLNYLDKVKRLSNRFEPVYISDHLCWTAHGGLHSNDLLPLPYTEEAVKHVAKRIRQAQDYLGRRLLIENVSSYLSYQESAMSEAEFFVAVVEEADCDILCDINNIYVSAKNHQFDAKAYIDAVPASRVKEMHLAGFENQGDFLLDTHGYPVHEPVWELYQHALAHFGEVPTLIEWDSNIPEFSVLLEERRRAMSYWSEPVSSSSLVSTS